jgi:hypothetical protein
VEAAGTTYRAGGGSTVPPPPISLQEPSRFRVFLEDVSEVSERWQLPPRERVSPRSRAPSISSRSRHVRVRLPPPPLFSRGASPPRTPLRAHSRDSPPLKSTQASRAPFARARHPFARSRSSVGGGSAPAHPPTRSLALSFGPGYDWRARVTTCVPGTEFGLEMTKADADWTGSRWRPAREPRRRHACPVPSRWVAGEQRALPDVLPLLGTLPARPAAVPRTR